MPRRSPSTLSARRTESGFARPLSARSGEQQRDLGDIDPVRLADFLAIPDEIIQYRIDSLWPSGGRVVLAAQFKAGKTTLTSNAVRSLADADPFLDRFTTMPAQVVLLDFEMDPSKVRQWLRDQQIRNRDSVSVIPLRGKVSSFDILDPQTRAEWAARIRGNDVAIFDCLRPILDSLGLDENSDAGRLLTALLRLPRGVAYSHTTARRDACRSGAASARTLRMSDYSRHCLTCFAPTLTAWAGARLMTRWSTPDTGATQHATLARTPCSG